MLERKTPSELSASIALHLQEYFTAHEGSPPSGLYDRIVQEVERPLLQLALRECRGNQIRAAALLGINRNTLRKKLRGLGIAARQVRR